MDEVNEVTIVGAGPAGIAASIYFKRAELHPILLEKNEPGGLLRHAFLVENYPASHILQNYNKTNVSIF